MPDADQTDTADVSAPILPDIDDDDMIPSTWTESVCPVEPSVISVPATAPVLETGPSQIPPPQTTQSPDSPDLMADIRIDSPNDFADTEESVSATEESFSGGQQQSSALWMPGGPRTPILLTTYETHIARAIYDAILSRATDAAAEDVPDVVDPVVRLPMRRRRTGPAALDDDEAEPAPAADGAAQPRGRARRQATQDLTRKVLRIHFRTAYTASMDAHISREEDSWYSVAERSGLLGLRTVGVASAIDSALISAFVERWHPETNTFHFAWGEMTITLHDVYQILGLPIHGRSVRSDMQDSAVRAKIADDLGVELTQIQTWFRMGGIPVADIETVMRSWLGLDPIPTGLIAAYYILVLLGSTVLVDKSTTKVKHGWMPLLWDHDAIPEYAWGAAILAWVYRNLGQASRQVA